MYAVNLHVKKLNMRLIQIDKKHKRKLINPNSEFNRDVASVCPVPYSNKSLRSYPAFF